ncbi:hypothetical protein C8J57DRAFT_1734190 [Mycena rebaudengoi]|nr:hypothetical protein C8J57DRAFT_1734190 [Mycena rebaudengoi]
MPQEVRVGCRTVAIMMNRCFGIRELVELFCSPLTRSQDLISFARACKSFLEPGLDNLWKEQSTLANLLLCMPSDLFNVLDDLPQPGSTSKNTYKQMHLLRPIVATDWERPSFYAQRVQRFYLLSGPPFSRVRAPEGVLQLLNLSFPGDYLFPSLKSLILSPGAESFAYIRPFLSPNLRDIKLHFPVPTGNHHISLLSALGCKYPKVKNVEISIWSQSGSDTFLAAISSFLARLTSIESLTLHDIDLTGLGHLGRLPTLKKLALHRLPPLDTTSIESTSYSSFCGLEEFCLEDAQIIPTVRFIQMWSAAPLVSLALEFTSYPTAAAMDSLYHVISAHCKHSSLWNIVFHYPSDMEMVISPTDREKHLLQFSTLHSLFPFHDLSTVKELAQAWPEVVELNLGILFESSTRSPSVTIQCLQSFAQDCPSLRKLVLSLDATILPNETTPVRGEPHLLRQLRVGFSPIYSPLHVAKFLSATFPVLYDIAAESYIPSRAAAYSVAALPYELLAAHPDSRSWPGSSSWAWTAFFIYLFVLSSTGTLQLHRVL